MDAASVVSAKWGFRGLLLVLLFAAYANSFGLGAVMDGQVILRQDSRIRALNRANIELILEKHYWWPATVDRLYRPVTTASFLFNWAVMGDANTPGGYHLLNFALHAVNVWVVFELAFLLFQRAGPAFFAAALWGVHPVGVESVANIAGRADLLSAAGVLGALLLYARTAGASGRKRWLALAGLFVLSAFGVFAKENGAVLVGLMLLWDITFGRLEKRRLPAYAAAVLPLALLFWGRSQVFYGVPVEPASVLNNPLLGAGFLASRLAAVKIIVMELWLLVCPIHLLADHSYSEIPIPVLGDPLGWLAVLFVASLLAFVIARHRKDRMIFWGAGFLGIALLPTSNLLVRIGAPMADRFLYLPGVGFAVAVTALAWRLKPRRFGVGLLGVAVLLCAGRTYARNPAWQSDLSLASTDVQAGTRSFRLHFIYGESLYMRNPQSLDTAIRELETAWTILKPWPDSTSYVPAILGAYYGLKGDRVGGSGTSEGRAWYEKSLAMLLNAKQISVAYQKAFDERAGVAGAVLPSLVAYESLDFDLGQAYWRLGRRAEAIEWYAHGRVRRPENPVGYDTLAIACLEDGSWARAAVALEEEMLVGGMTPAALRSLREAYSKIPEGACAVRRDSGVDLLNPDCPRLRSDMCDAAAELKQIFAEGRKEEDGRRIQQAAAREYGCPAAAP
jgi:tetratricopeptide (TPR) repeat protein